MLSKTRIRPYGPKHIDQFVQVYKAAHGAGFTPGTLVVLVNNRLVACDTDSALHKELPAFLTWEDGSTRFDMGPVYEKDGTKHDHYTCFVGEILADLGADCFTATPEAGDTLVKSATAGKIDPLSAAELATLMGTDVENYQLKIGVVQGPSFFGSSGMYNCKLKLG
jgi:hypothetical protein